MRVRLLLLVASAAAMLPQQQCLNGRCDDEVHLPKRVDVVSHTIFTAMNADTGRRERHVLMTQRDDDPAAVANRACEQWRIDRSECHTLVDAVSKRWRAAVGRPKRLPEAATLHLMLQYYNDKYPPRQAELDASVRFNLANPHVQLVHNFLEPHTVLPDWMARHPKMRVHRRNAGRLTFKEAFEFSSTQLPVGSTAVITNLDIYLDHESNWDTFQGNLSTWTNGIAQGSFSLALSRHEADLDGNLWRNSDLEKSAYAIAQDVWVFKTPIQVEDTDYAIGNCPGSDNAIADRLARAGRPPLNLPHLFRTYHLDVARKNAASDVLPAMLVTQSTDLSRPHLRGNRILPAFGEVSTFEDLKAYQHTQPGWKVDPVMEYMYLVDFLAKTQNIGQKFVNGDVIEGDYNDIDSLMKIRQQQKQAERQRIG